jgi:ferrous iron transport protein B
MSETTCVAAAPSDQTVVLVGLESTGKSAIFRALTGRAVGDESNFRRFNAVMRTCRVAPYTL